MPDESRQRRWYVDLSDGRTLIGLADSAGDARLKMSRMFPALEVLDVRPAPEPSSITGW